MSISIRARRTAFTLFATTLIAASCALPGYDVGESGTTATGSTASAGGSQTSTGTGGAGGEGQGGGSAGGGGEGGAGGSGGNSGVPVCPDMPPVANSACAWPTFKCMYPTEGKSCCNTEFKCVGNDPGNSTWVLISTELNCPPAECPQNCSPVCPAEPPPSLGCPCRVEQQLICNYNGCAANAGVQQIACAPSANPGGKSLWVNKGVHECCDPGASGQCQGCATHEDVNGKPVSFCP